MVTTRTEKDLVARAIALRPELIADQEEPNGARTTRSRCTSTSSPPASMTCTSRAATADWSFQCRRTCTSSRRWPRGAADPARPLTGRSALDLDPLWADPEVVRDVVLIARLDEPGQANLA